MVRKTIIANNPFMQEAIIEAQNGIHNKDGGPFGCVIVKNNKIIGRGHNKVVKNNDPTCHGEIDAIRDACKNISSFDLKGCDVYTTGEPCHMCLTACLWANVNKIFYGCTIKENEIIGFRDAKFDSLFHGRDKLDHLLVQIDHEACLELFDEYNHLDKTNY